MARKTAEEAARTRSAIVDAALGLFAERGFAGAQLEEIAARASVTRGALYHHFTDKGELYRVVLQERWETVMAPVFAALESDRGARFRLTAFVSGYLAMMDGNRQARALMKMNLSGDLALPALGADVVEKLQALAGWRNALARVLREAGREAGARERAQALLASLIGYATLSSLEGPPEPAVREQCARSFVQGALA
jgi:TetR/AcrR family transcriptional regulator, acrAB operon repressor